MNKKILILGANGLIGTNIFNFLKKKRLEIITCTREKNNFSNKNFSYGDLSKKKYIKKL